MANNLTKKMQERLIAAITLIYLILFIVKYIQYDEIRFKKKVDRQIPTLFSSIDREGNEAKEKRYKKQTLLFLVATIAFATLFFYLLINQ